MTWDLCLEISGWIGAFLFCVCGIPQVWQVIKQGHANGLSPTFLQMWLWGEIFTLIYVLPELLWPLIINYIINTILIGIILWYKYFPRKP